MRMGGIATALLVLASSFAGAETPNAYDNMWPNVSPDGKEIAFATTRDGGDWEIYVMNADGKNPRRLTRSPGRDAHPCFARSGDRIFFQSPRDYLDERLQVAIYVMNRDGGGQRRLIDARGGFSGVPVLSRDGRRIAFMRGVFDAARDAHHWELQLADSSGGHPVALTDNPWSSQVPSWFPGDRELAFFANPRGREQLFVLDVESRRVRPLLESEWNDQNPSVSPDGKSIAFVSDRGGKDTRDLHVLDAGSRRVRRLTQGFVLRSQPNWSPAGDRLFFSASRSEGVDEIYRILPDGCGLTRLTRGTEGVR